MKPSLLRALLFGHVLLYAAPLPAQLIGVKTVPIAAGEQFVIFPSSNFGMGGLSLAVDDRIGDVFSNPAKGSRIAGTLMIGSPTFYSISDGNGGGRTLPGTVLMGGGRMFGGATGAVQQLDRGRDRSFLAAPLPRDRNVTNAYGSGYVGTQLRNGWSVGASGFIAQLKAADGVDQLYAGSARIDQKGHVWDARVGALRELEGNRTLELVAVHSEVDMRHDVLYIDQRWDVPTRAIIQNVRNETNLDRTNTSGLHLGYKRPLGTEGARFGGIFTVNYKTHPKIPNYEIQNIPRDPGNTWAYNLGLGLSRQREKTTWGLDFIYEPIWSNTWQEADVVTMTPSGIPIPKGGRTIENHFSFSNVILRGGVSRESDGGGYQLGVQIKSIAYTLEQANRVQATNRTLDEGWTELTPTWSGFLKFPEMTLRYSGYVNANGISFGGGDRAMIVNVSAPEGPDIIAAANGPINLPDFSVWVHQISVTVPVGRRR